MRNMMVSLTACTLLCGAVYANDDSSPAPVAADAKADGTVSLKGGSVAVGIATAAAYTRGAESAKTGERDFQTMLRQEALIRPAH